MYMRSVLAALDFNANVNRPIKIVEGKPTFRKKVYGLKQKRIKSNLKKTLKNTRQNWT